jgi:hypothetical protein
MLKIVVFYIALHLIKIMSHVRFAFLWFCTHPSYCQERAIFNTVPPFFYNTRLELLHPLATVSIHRLYKMVENVPVTAHAVCHLKCCRIF